MSSAVVRAAVEWILGESVPQDAEAMTLVFERPIAISSVRGQWMDWRDIRVMPTYHPAYLLRNPAAKKDVWSDMKKVMAELGILL